MHPANPPVHGPFQQRWPLLSAQRGRGLRKELIFDAADPETPDGGGGLALQGIAAESGLLVVGVAQQSRRHDLGDEEVGGEDGVVGVQIRRNLCGKGLKLNVHLIQFICMGVVNVSRPTQQN